MSFLCRATTTSTAGSTAGTTAGAAASTGPKMSYQELEQAINKWTVELEEQEKIFLKQATQVNAWDRLLIENGEKVCYTSITLGLKSGINVSQHD